MGINTGFFVHFFTEMAEKNAPCNSAAKQSKRMGCELWDMLDYEKHLHLIIYIIYSIVI